MPSLFPVPELTVPTTDLHPEWLDAHREWAGTHQDGSGLGPGDDVASATGFADYVARLLREASEDEPPPPGRVPCTYWWITEGRVVLGAVALRHTLNDFLLEAGGHVGYSVRPSARRRGLAGWALGEVLRRASRTGIDPVLITCDVDNVASRRTIESHGGVLDDVRDTTIGRVRRYWIRGAGPA